MRRFSLALITMVGVTACDPVPYQAVAIRPTYDYEDGCAQVKVTGSGFEDDVSATIGGNALESPVLPSSDPETYPDHEVGFALYGVAPQGAPGFADVAVTSGGETQTIANAFYYVACPGGGERPWPEVVAPPAETVSSGDAVFVAGCGIDPDKYEIEVRDPTATVETETVQLTSVCRTAQATFAAPDMPDGTYEVYFVSKADGTQLYPAECVTTDTGTTCPDGFIYLTYGAAE